MLYHKMYENLVVLTNFVEYFGIEARFQVIFHFWVRG
jgi:hypothetical protein